MTGRPAQPNRQRRLGPWLAALAILAVATAVLVIPGNPALAQAFSFDLGADAGGSTTARVIQLIALMTVLTLAPSILVMVTSFTRIVVVLSFLRTAMGTQQTPPSQIIISLALFVTIFIMTPVFQESYDTGIQPLIDGQIDEFESFNRTMLPVQKFMMVHVRERDLALFADIAKMPDLEVQATMPLRILIPAFIISELRRAFEIGFLVFVPFLIIDMVVASVLMSMGMMMLPPIIIALPFKIIFFVLVDGWYMIVGSLVRSFGA